MKGREIIVGILVAVGVVLVGLILLGFLWGLGGMGGWGMMSGPGMMGRQGMMGGWSSVFWLLFCLGTLFLGALLIGGIVWLVSNRGGTLRDVTTPQENCPNCGQPVQKNWNNCPNCGQLLRNE